MIDSRPAAAEGPGVDTLAAARGGDEAAFRSLIAPHLRELRAFCYRMSGSVHDAEDLMQDSLLRAWRGLATFEGRSTLRTWLYKVTWSACSAALEARPSRVLAIESGAPGNPHEPMSEPTDDPWLGPCPPAYYGDPSPEARYSSRQTIALAFLAALQLLPPRQRATLIARDVLGWSAEECAESLESTVPSVNSALQRARATLDARVGRWQPRPVDDDATKHLLARYIEAWERADPSTLAALLREDATFAMPPFPTWLLGPEAICHSVKTMVFDYVGAGSFRFVPTEANGLPALAAYRKATSDKFEFASIHALSIHEGKLDAITVFLDPKLAAPFELPAVMGTVHTCDTSDL